MGDVARMKGSNQEALRHYKKALEYAGNNPQLFYKTGNTYLALNDVNNAANYFNAAIQSAKNFPQPYYGMYQVYRSIGNDQEANKYLQMYQQLMGM
jgi:tetratricopeptide (TPR) repeat protein